MQRATAKELPHLVEILVPPGGLGGRLDEMLAFHRKLGISPHLGKRRAREGDYLRWRFADLAHAIHFAMKYGGKHLSLTNASAPDHKRSVCSK